LAFSASRSGIYPFFQQTSRNTWADDVGRSGAEAKGSRITFLDGSNQRLDHFQGAEYWGINMARAYIGGEQEAWTRKASWKQHSLSVATKVFHII